MRKNNQWPSKKVQESQASLESLISLIETWEDIGKSSSFRKLDDRIQDSADSTKVLLGKLAIVRSCGFLEIILEDSIREYASKHYHTGIKEYVDSTLGRGKKADPDRIYEVIKLFCSESDFSAVESILSENDKFHHGNINSLISYRNKIAHGLSEDVNPTKALRLSSTALEVGKLLIDILIEKKDTSDI